MTWLELKNTVFVFPTHPNPEVQSAIKKVLKEPLANLFFNIANELPRNGLLDEKLPFAMTDSGGLQEELPTFKNQFWSYEIQPKDRKQ